MLLNPPPGYKTFRPLLTYIKTTIFSRNVVIISCYVSFEIIICDMIPTTSCPRFNPLSSSERVRKEVSKNQADPPGIRFACVILQDSMTTHHQIRTASTLCPRLFRCRRRRPNSVKKHRQRICRDSNLPPSALTRRHYPTWFHTEPPQALTCRFSRQFPLLTMSFVG